MIAPLSLALSLVLVAQAPAATKDDRAARLDFMKASLATYTVRPAGDGTAAYRLLPEPALRYSNPVGDSQDGAIFFWVGEDDRPEVAVQVFFSRWRGAWVHDFTALATVPVVAETPAGPAWRPIRAGMDLRPIPEAAEPADTPEGRLRQMHDLVRRFAVTDDFRQKGPQPLRPLARPFARYGKPGGRAIDGAVFCFALGTDPEAFLLLEARPVAGREAAGPAWHYGLAPQTTYALKATLDGKDVWSLPDRRNPWDPAEPFFSRSAAPNPR